MQDGKPAEGGQETPAAETNDLNAVTQALKKPSEAEPDLDPYTEQFISDEVLKHRISKLSGEPKPTSWWNQDLWKQIIVLFVGFFLTGVVGAYLNYVYGEKQKELEDQRTAHQKEIDHKRSFADEFNKVRVSKIAEVWEKVDQYEAIITEVLNRVSKDQQTGLLVVRQADKDLLDKYERGVQLYNELKVLLAKNRFWLGKQIHDEIEHYADATNRHMIALLGKQETKELEEDSIRARTELDQLVDKMLKGEL